MGQTNSQRTDFYDKFFDVFRFSWDRTKITVTIFQFFRARYVADYCLLTDVYSCGRKVE